MADSGESKSWTLPRPPSSCEPPRSQVTFKTLASVALALCLTVGLAFVLLKARFAFTLIAVAAIISVALDHAVVALRRLGLRRNLAIAVVFLLLLGALTGTGFLLVPLAIAQGEALIRSLPKVIADIRATRLWHRLDDTLSLESRLADFLDEIPHWLEQAAPSALKAAGQIVTGVTGLFTVILLTLFMLAFAPALIRALLAEALPSRQERYARVVDNLYRSIGGFASGLAIVVVANAVCTSIFLAIIRVPYFLPLGVVSGLSSLVPLVGNTLAGVLLSLVALASGGLWKGIGTAIYCVLYQQVENHLLGPLVYRQTVNINPLVSMLALLVMTDLAGLIGALAAVPLVAVLQVVLGEVVALRREKWGIHGGSPALSENNQKNVSGANNQKTKNKKEKSKKSPSLPPRPPPTNSR